MRSVKGKPVLFIAAIIMSVMLHTLLIAGVSGIRGFVLLESSPGRIILTSIVSEKIHKPRTPGKSEPASKPEDTGNSSDKDEASSSGMEMKEIQDSKDASEKSRPVEGNQDETKEVHESGGEVAKSENDGKETSLLKTAKPDAPRLSGYLRESFHFDIYWLGIYVGDAVLESYSDNGVLKISSQVHSAPVISAFYEVEDYAESKVANGLPFNFRIKQHEGKYRSDKETLFDIGNNRIIFSNYLSGTKDEHLTDKVHWDVISGFYYLRNQPFKEGETVYVDVFDSNKFLKVGVNILRRERIKTADMGEVDTVVVKLLLQSDGLFQSRGDILIWLSDDDARVPLRVETKAPIGYVVAELKQFEKE